MRRLLVAALIAAPIAGCVGPNPDLGADVSGLPPAPGASAGAVVITQDVTPPKGSRLVGPVRGTSCKNKMWDPDPTNEDALEKLKVVAASQGANRISNVTYTAGGTSVMTNCWAPISASGTAYFAP